MANVNDLAKTFNHKELSILETALSKYLSSTLLTGQARQPFDILYGQIKSAKEATKNQLHI